MAVLPSGDRVVSAGQEIKVWNAASGACLVTWGADSTPVTRFGATWDSGWVNGVAVFPKGDRIVSECYDNTLRLWG